jgi:hypothetical protein
VGGYSMKQLRAAAAARGLRLSGVRLSKDIGRLGAPALLHFQRQQHGHFVVVLPVGHSGKLVQVLDGERPAVVVYAAEVSHMPGWTGLALVPERPNWLAWAAGGIALASGLALAAMLMRQWLRPRTVTASAVG